MQRKHKAKIYMIDQIKRFLQYYKNGKVRYPKAIDLLDEMRALQKQKEIQ